MPAPALTYPDLVKLKPCPERAAAVAERLGGARKWNGNPITAQQARDAGVTFNDLRWVVAAVARSNPDVERRLRLWLADCAARVLHIFEQERPTDMRPREAVIAARRFARGEINATAWAAAGDAAWDAGDAARDAAWAAGAAWDAGEAAGAAAWAAARAAGAAGAAAGAAAGDAAGAAARAAGAAEEQWQFDRLVMWLSDDEPEDWPLPEIQTVKKDAA